MSLSALDHQHMAEALRLARRGLYTTDPNPRVGCVVAHGEQIVGRGWHQRAGGPHAEVIALQEAGARARGATAYVTLEPCCHYGRTPPCSDALIAAGVARVVAAQLDPNPRVAGGGFERLRAAGVECSAGLLAAEAAELNCGFLSRMIRKRPFVRVKLAMSLDGRTAMASGESRWISGDASRRDVQRLRARSSAILSGVGTVLADDPSLTVRLDPAELGLDTSLRQPLRVLLDSSLRIPAESRLLTLAGETLILCNERADAASALLSNPKVEVVQLAAGRDGGVDLHAVMAHLAEREINELMVEAGPTLAGALLQAELIDELVIYLAPHLMGDAARGLFALPGVTEMADRISLELVDIRRIGADLRLTLRTESAALFASESIAPR